MGAFSVRGPIARSDLPGLCDRICALLEPGEQVCDVAGVEPDAVTIDALARSGGAAQRRGGRIRLEHASPELRELVELLGLSEILLA